MTYSDSPNSLDHSIFNREDLFGNAASRSFHSAPSGGGGLMGRSSETNTSSSTEDTEDQVTEEEEEEAEEPLVQLSSAEFIEPSTAKIDQDISVTAEFEYLTDRTPPLFFTLKATYNGVEQLGPAVSAEVSETTATAVLNLEQHSEFYFTEDREESDKITYTFTVRCDDGSELQGDVIELPGLPLTIDIIEAADTLFTTNSAVPCIDNEGLLVATIQKTYEHADEWPDKEIIIYGHTDTTGENDLNYTLSEKRAKAVKALISNDSDSWNEAIEGNALVIDYQKILNCLSSKHSWSCNCGAADGEDGPNTQGGVEKFQNQYNEKYEQSIGVDGTIGPQTWGAIMNAMFRVATNEFEISEAPLMFGYEETGYYPCGESFPIEEALLDSYNSATNRRCEIGFHERPNPPALVAHEPPTELVTIEECPVYDVDFCELNIIQCINSSNDSLFIFSL